VTRDPRFALALAVAVAASFGACRPRETAETTRLRTGETFLLAQIADLKTLAARAEAGDVQTADRIAIGISEETAKALFDVSLPQEKVLGDRVRVRVVKAQPYFQGNNAAVLFEADAQGKSTGAQARLELGGRLVNFRVDDGRLRADVELVHFKVLDSSLAILGSGVLESLIQDNLGVLAELTPHFEVPVRLEHSIKIGGLQEGVVTTKGGVLPLAMSVAEVMPLNRRLWVFLEVKAGPWQREAKAAAP
jgi:hypothetical protein